MEFFVLYLYIALSEFLSSEGFELMMVFSVMFGGGATAFHVILTANGEDMIDDEDRLNATTALLGKARNVFITFICIGLFLTMAIPSKEGIAWIIGGGVAYNIAQSEEARKLPDNVIRAANRFLESVDAPELEVEGENNE